MEDEFIFHINLFVSIIISNVNEQPCMSTSKHRMNYKYHVSQIIIHKAFRESVR